MDNSVIRISLAQYDIAWENKSANLAKIENIVENLSGITDIVVLPEMFSTGFSMNSHSLAEPIEGETITLIKHLSQKHDLAICGSYIAIDNGTYYNRGFFITRDEDHYYDKRHLFGMGNEPKYFKNGKKRLVFKHKGFNICLLICYDLRFPVWARNVDNEYDLLIYVANWPASRAKVWYTLLDARAIENMCYVCGVNRIGTDGNGLLHEGGSKLVNAKGQEMTSIVKGEDIQTVAILKKELDEFRQKFPVWKDADRFVIE